MKRNREVAIVVSALVSNGLLEERKSDVARHIVKEAFKEIRQERYREKQTKNCQESRI